MSIYKITGGDLCYIGSTTQKINERFSKHKDNYRVWKTGGKRGYCSSYQVFDKAGIENCKVELLEQTETTKDRERFYVENNVCVNKNIPNRSKKEYMEAHKEFFKEWRKEYWEKNKEKINEYNKKKFDCECGGKYTMPNRAVHYRTLLHLTLYPQPQSQKIHPIPS